MKKVIKKILDFTVILSLLCILILIGWTIYNSVVAYQGYNYCPGFFCEEVRYYSKWDGVLAFFRDKFFLYYFICSICCVLPLILLPLCTYISVKILNTTNNKWFLIIPVLCFCVSFLLGIFDMIFKFIALFAGIYGGTFIISYFIALLYKKIFSDKT